MALDSKNIHLNKWPPRISTIFYLNLKSIEELYIKNNIKLHNF